MPAPSLLSLFSSARKPRTRAEEYRSFLETLEDRIAPAGLSGVTWKTASFDTPILLKAGEGLSDSAGGTGGYMLHVAAGQALVFLSDLNGNGRVDPNEITGIAAGDGLRLTAFVDINGDIATNLRPDGTLTDSDANPLNGNDGRVILNSRIDSITMRTLTAADVGDNYLVNVRPTSYSIYGNIYAGAGFGVVGGGLTIDTTGWSTLTSRFNGVAGNDYVGGDLYPSVGFIATGTAVTGKGFSFGTAASNSNVRGSFAEFVPAAGQIGGDIIGVSVGQTTPGVVDPANPTAPVTPTVTPGKFGIGGLFAGDGGAGARGGNIQNVILFGDEGGFFAIAGNGGHGVNGGAGGSITNLTDLGSITTTVVIKTGDGGHGLTGRGGAGGTLTLGQFSTTGNISITLGDGGDGTLAGGNGAGLGSAKFTPTDLQAIPIPLKIVTTYRDAGDIGNLSYDAGTNSYKPKQIDFDGDGIGDYAFIGKNPGQLGVWLSSTVDPITAPSGIISYLSSPVYSTDASQPLAVGDFNGDGYLDIATASSAAYSHDGLYIYLWNPVSNGFELPSRSAIPFWNIDFDQTGQAPRLRSGGAVTDLVVGDFNHDGVLDIGLLQQNLFTIENDGKTTDLIVMSGSGDGYFYADFARDSNTQKITKVPITPVAKAKHDEVLLGATAAERGNLDSDLLITVVPTTKAIATYDFGQGSVVGTTALKQTSTATGEYKVRTWSDKNDAVQFAQSATAATPIDFAIVDISANGTADGYFDLVTLNQNGVVIAFRGASANGVSLAQPDGGRGMIVTGEFGPSGAPKDEYQSTFKGLLTGDFDGKADTTELAIYSIGASNNQPLAMYSYTLSGYQQTYTDGTKAATGGLLYGSEFGFTKPSPLDNKVVAFATYTGDITSDTTGFLIGTPNSEKIANAYLQTNTGSVFGLNLNGFNATLGNGGNSSLGAGGAGGSLGNGSLSVATDGTISAGIQIVIPRSDNGFSQAFTYVAGSGGTGFTLGGAGGSVSGIAASYTGNGNLASDVLLVAGRGGDSITGTGGIGGSIRSLNVETLGLASAGSGGSGKVGGAGGSVTGNGIAGLFDATNSDIIVTAGDGGNGVTAGGSGGSITNFKVGFLALVGGIGGSIRYTAGNGGDAVSGRGGVGGSIVSVSPLDNINYLAGPIFLQAGNGGSGQTGGAGGSVNTFRNSPLNNVPTVVSVVSGNGGVGYTGNGGNGGSITNVSATGTGISFNDNLLFNRAIAGTGGVSYGATGGNGGSIVSTIITSQTSSTALAAGAGGAGLLRGGLGGSVLSSQATSAGAPSKVLVIAGDGGSAYGYTSAGSLQAQLLSAGTNGIGGNGGSISNFRGTGNNVNTDLIAGNGGDLMSYGLGIERPGVGRGGSVSGIRLDGNAGNIAPDAAIQSYNGPGQSMQDFVNQKLLGNNGDTLTDADGNVGVVVGAAGRVSVNLSPSTQGYGAIGGVNGSVNGFSALNIMSMVAGSVNRISAILSLSGVSVPVGGVLGAYKNTPVPHQDAFNPQVPLSGPLYFGPDGSTTSSAIPGGRLMDGAIVTNLPTSLQGPRVFPKGA